MRSRGLIIVTSFLIFLLSFNNHYSQNQNKIAELTKKLQDLSTQAAKCGGDYNCINKLVKEMEKTAKELQQAQAQTQTILPPNNYPPIINKIIEASLRSNNLMVDANQNCDLVNNTTKEIIKDIYSVYTSEIKDTLPKPCPIYVTYCKMADFTIKESGVFDNGQDYVEYELTMTNKAPWMARYAIDIAGGTGKEIDLHLRHTDPHTTNVTINKFEGWVWVTINNQAVKAPLVHYDFPQYFNDGPQGVTIWPYTKVNEEYTEYSLNIQPAEVHFYPAVNPDDQYAPSCGHGPELTIPIKELREAIQKGRLHKVITDEVSYCKMTFEVDIEFPAWGCESIAAPKGAIALDGECIDHGGFIMAGDHNLFVNGKSAARVGDKVLCLIHGITEITGDQKVNAFSSNKRIARVGDKTACGAVILGGSQNTFIGVK